MAYFHIGELGGISGATISTHVVNTSNATPDQKSQAMADQPWYCNVSPFNITSLCQEDYDLRLAQVMGAYEDPSYHFAPAAPALNPDGSAVTPAELQQLQYIWGQQQQAAAAASLNTVDVANSPNTPPPGGPGGFDPSTVPWYVWMAAAVAGVVMVRKV
jgi:hypothetical protein